MDFYKYSPTSGGWCQIADIGNIGRYDAASFWVNNEGYVATGRWGICDTTIKVVTNEVWKYDTDLNQWNLVTIFPVHAHRTVGFSVSNTGFVCFEDKVYKYKDIQWESVPGPITISPGTVAFSIGEMAYFGLGRTNHELWEYNPSSESYKQCPKRDEVYQYSTSAFVINDKAYIIGGVLGIAGSPAQGKIWEFDPSKPEQ